MEEMEEMEKEKWYLLELNIRDVPEIKEELAKEKIPFAEITVKKPKEISGIAFPSGEAVRVLRIMGNEFADYKETETEIENLQLLQRWKVITSGGNFEGKEELCEEILRPYSERFATDIEICVPHGNAHEPVSDGRLHIFVWSVPGRLQYVARETLIFGVKTERAGGDGCEPSGKGIIVSSPEGIPVAEVMENNIYVLFDMVHQSKRVCEHHLKEILRLTVPLAIAIGSKSPEAKKTLEEIAQREQSIHRQAYVQECTKRLKEKFKSLQENIQRAKKELRESSKNIVQKRREMEIKKIELKKLEASLPGMEMQFSQEFKTLWEVPIGRSIVNALSGFKEEEKKNLQQNYIKQSKEWIEKEIEGIKEEISEIEDSLQRESEIIVREARNLEQNQKKLEELRNFDRESREQFSKEFDKLCHTPGVKEVKVSEGRISVFTEEIFIEHEGKTYQIGHFRIDLNTEEGTVEAFNLDRRVGVTDHPHIKLGECCFGNLDEGLAKLVSQYEYSVVFQVILQWLKTYTYEEDYKPYSAIEEWPRGDKK